MNDTQLGCSRRWQIAGSRALSCMHVIELAIVSWPRRCCTLSSIHDNQMLAHRLYVHVPAFCVMTSCGKLSCCLGHNTAVFVDDVIGWCKHVHGLGSTSCKSVKSKTHAHLLPLDGSAWLWSIVFKPRFQQINANVVSWVQLLVAIVFVHRPLRKHWKSTRPLRTSTWVAVTLAMKEPRPGAWHRGLWLQASKQWNKMEWSGVLVVFQTCETLVLLDGCLGVGPVVLSKRVIEMGWKQDEKWDGGGCSDTCKAREKIHYKYQTSIKQYLALDCFSGNAPWLWLVILALNSWWWTWLHVSVADRLVSSQVSHGLPPFLSTGPCRSIESQQHGYRHRLGTQ